MSRFTASGGFIYAGPYKSRDKAESSLEDCFASGEVCLGEGPRVERYRDHHGRVVGYVVVVNS
jgi:hypothetical protein